MRLIPTTRFHRGKLPHWEVERGHYFVTARLADSLPHEVILRLQEIHQSLAAIEAQSAPFVTLQRVYFRTMEKYLDAGSGACVLRQPQAASIVEKELAALQEWGIAVPHFTIMPNHWHALVIPNPDCTRSLAEIMKRVKGRTGKAIRQMIGGPPAPVWQREWFDRWMRTKFEEEKTVHYIRENPVKAGLVARWQDHPWTK